MRPEFNIKTQEGTFDQKSPSIRPKQSQRSKFELITSSSLMRFTDDRMSSKNALYISHNGFYPIIDPLKSSTSGLKSQITKKLGNKNLSKSSRLKKPKALKKILSLGQDFDISSRYPKISPQIMVKICKSNP